MTEDINNLKDEARKLHGLDKHVLSLTLARIITYRTVHPDLIAVLIAANQAIPAADFETHILNQSESE